MTTMASTRWYAGRSDELPERGRLIVDLGPVGVGIFRLDGQLHAYENVCAHAGGPVCQGLMVPRVVELLDDRRAIAGSKFHDRDFNIVCPWHGAEYDIRTGEHAGLRSLRLRRIAVCETNGAIYVDL
jgi:nitrite reductase/ring-hydroxylating ferredoxin subunit